MIRLTLATRNAHKTREFRKILGEGYLVTDLVGAVDIPFIEETGTTFEENAAIKARTVSALIEGLVVSDDSGLEVKALRGAPGIRSARYAGENATDQENVLRLLGALRDLGEENNDRSACFRCIIALAEDGEVLHTFGGTVHGRISTGLTGSDGFGYDPVFIPAGHSETFSKLGDQLKNQISHRARAIEKLRNHLSTILVEKYRA